MSYEQMTADQLQSELDKINANRDALAAQARTVAGLLSKKLAEEAAKAKLEGMTETERAALAQVIQAQGIESAERVNGQ